MSIEIIIEPWVVYSLDRFCAEKAAHSVVLDGFFDASTRRDPRGPYANFDHHAGSRLSPEKVQEIIAEEIRTSL